MRTFALGRWDGINTAGNEFFRSMPHFEDPQETLDLSPDHFEGDALPIALGTTADVVEGEHRWISRFIWRCLSHAEQRTFFEHQQSRLGACRSFWMPSWRSDFRITRDIQPHHRNLLLVEPDNHFEFVYEDNRYGISIVDDDQLIHVWQIVGYDPVEGKLMLSANHNLFLPRARIQFASLVRRVRFRADKFQWSFQKDSIVDIPGEVIECPGEGSFSFENPLSGIWRDSRKWNDTSKWNVRNG